MYEIDDGCSTVLLVEHRDEVFARIAADMAEAGMYVARAESAEAALKLAGGCKPALLVANIDLPDQSGWLLAAQLPFVNPNIRMWVYQSASSASDEGMARFLHIDQLLEYGGDLFGLSEAIIQLMAADRRERNRAACDSHNVARMAVA